MKFLFWLIVALVVWWAYKRARTAGTHPTPPASPTSIQDMVTCARCGIHLPHNEAVAGMRGQYCSAEHRSAAGDRNPE